MNPHVDSTSPRVPVSNVPPTSIASPQRGLRQGSTQSPREERVQKSKGRVLTFADTSNKHKGCTTDYTLTTPMSVNRHQEPCKEALKRIKEIENSGSKPKIENLQICNDYVPSANVRPDLSPISYTGTCQLYPRITIPEARKKLEEIVPK